jgi:hypothetical protein
MKTPDRVAGVLDPYINRFELWNNSGAEYATGDAVPAVGMAASYSIQLPAPGNERQVFLQVQDGRITNVMALQPIGDKSVFDPRGRFLGTGGKELEPISLALPKKPVDIITAVQQMNQPAPPTQQQVHEPTTPPPVKERPLDELIDELKEMVDDLPEPDPTVHRFHLRPDFEVKIKLPDDLTEREGERLAAFLKSLPYGDDEESRFE